MAFRLRLCVVSLCRDRGRDGNGFVVRMLADVEQDQGGFGEVAFIGDLPFVVGFDEHRAGQAQQGGGVGKDPDDVGAALDLFVEPLFYPALVGRSIRCGSDFSGLGGAGGR